MLASFLSSVLTTNTKISFMMVLTLVAKNI
jgi:hypothetical protein